MMENRADEKPLVLVAEDRDSNYMLVAAILKNEYKLIRANDGKEAIALCKSTSPDIVLMDMLMPIIDGKEATLEIRKMNTTVPIIAVTAYAFDQDRKKAMEIGCNDYISKPINATTLREVIKKHLKTRINVY